MEKNKDMDILERIKQLQKERGWSNYKLSYEAELPQSTINNMYSRQTQPSIHNLELICKAFGITLSQFFSEDSSNIVLSNDEQKLIFEYRKLNKKNKHLIELIIKELI